MVTSIRSATSSPTTSIPPSRAICSLWSEVATPRTLMPLAISARMNALGGAPRAKPDGVSRLDVAQGIFAQSVERSGIGRGGSFRQTAMRRF